MTIDEMLEVLQAAKRGETVECRLCGASTWKPIPFNQPSWAFDKFDYRIAPKKEMTLVERAREEAQDDPDSLLWKLADRIEELEAALESIQPSEYTTDELLAEIKRRTSC
jgi:hypothetical protein